MLVNAVDECLTCSISLMSECHLRLHGDPSHDVMSRATHGKTLGTSEQRAFNFHDNLPERALTIHPR